MSIADSESPATFLYPSFNDEALTKAWRLVGTTNSAAWRGFPARTLFITGLSCRPDISPDKPDCVCAIWNSDGFSVGQEILIHLNPTDGSGVYRTVASEMDFSTFDATAAPWDEPVWIGGE